MSHPAIPAGTTILTISDLNAAVKGTLEQSFQDIWLAGEVSNLVKHGSGHWYLSLKDARSQLKAVMYRGINLRLKFDLRDGMEVFVCGRMSVYAARGEAQFNIEQLHPKGLGAVDLALRQSREKLRAKGYFDPKRKRDLPPYPNRIGIVTSPTGAAIRDLLRVLGERWPLAEVVLHPARVQGDGAAEEITAAIDTFNRLASAGHLPVDVLIVGRGGGSAEDLWAFNDELVAEAIFRSGIPIVSAVGHEIDRTTADYVADHSSATPTHAATETTPDCREMQSWLMQAQGRLTDGLRRRLQLARRQLDQIASRGAFKRPLERIRMAERQLDDLEERLRRAIRRRLDSWNERVAGLAARLESVSPLQVVARGYTLTRTEDGVLIRSAEQISPGMRLLTTLRQGLVISRVEEVRPELPASVHGVTDDSTPPSWDAR